MVQVIVSGLGTVAMIIIRRAIIIKSGDTLVTDVIALIGLGLAASFVAEIMKCTREQRLPVFIIGAVVMFLTATLLSKVWGDSQYTTGILMVGGLFLGAFLGTLHAWRNQHRQKEDEN